MVIGANAIGWCVFNLACAEVNQLTQVLSKQIRMHGPLSIAEYMAAALGHPKWGYYNLKDPLGSSGDFTTAPEVSQVFGELIGVWCANWWCEIGAPEKCILAELGPGRGTLIADALRAASILPEFKRAAEIHLVETSPVFRAMQEMALEDQNVIWHNKIENLPEGPVIVIANEFFDVLPIRQFQATEDGWHERLVDFDEDGFRLVLSPLATSGYDLPSANPGDVYEISLPRESAMSDLAKRIVDEGGAGLIIDYGHTISAVGDTLQAIKSHKYTDPLKNPGQADITAHVDFQVLCRSAKSVGARTYGPVSQGKFLQQLGIFLRADRLRLHATKEQQTNIDLAIHRLIHKDQMGDLFKVLVITKPSDPAPPGFEEN